MLRMLRSKKTLARLHLLISLLLFTTLGSATTTAQCKCAPFTVRANLEEVKGGEIVEFEADRPHGEFNWAISEGTIVSGQGTNKISIQTTDEMGKRPPAPRPDGLNAYFGSSQRLGTVITAVAEPILTTCKCPSQSASVRVGYRSIPQNTPANVTDLQLSPDKLVLACVPGQKPGEGQKISDSLVVDVTAAAHDADNDVLVFEYTVTAGRIIGRGSKVKWDLSGVEPGTHTITANADDGCGLCGKAKSAAVTIEPCIGCIFIDCPTLDISGPPHIKAGSISEFVAHVSGGSQQSVKYSWSVLNGEIVEGQGTPLIKVRAAKSLDPGTGRGSVSVTVKIGGLDPRGSCVDTVTEKFH
jgi:hypothetical protein